MCCEIHKALKLMLRIDCYHTDISTQHALRHPVYYASTCSWHWSSGAPYLGKSLRSCMCMMWFQNRELVDLAHMAFSLALE